ncbi:unnamed protein product [Alopecurus aequalis]
MDKLGANPANSCPLTPLGFLERAATVFGDCPSVVYHDTVFTWNQTYLSCLRLAQRAGHVRGAIWSFSLSSKTHFGSCLRGTLPLVSSSWRTPPEKKFPPRPAPALTYEMLLAKGDPEFHWVRPESEWDPMVLNYTSGTTSAPKGVVQCHRAIFLFTVDSLVDWAVPARPTYLWTLPMSHGNGWSFPWGMAVVGGTNVCLRRVVAAEVYDAIVRHGVAHLCGAPAVLNVPDRVRKPTPGVEVESVLYGHPAVREAAVVARPSEFWGETPCAFVSLKDGGVVRAVNEAEVIAWCRERMPRFMVPRTIVMRDELPKTSTGKIQKDKLRNLAKEMGMGHARQDQQ